MSSKLPVILGSASSSRKLLLQTMGIEPSGIITTDINEDPMLDESPSALAKRLAEAKALAIKMPESWASKEYFLITADTVTAVGRRIIDKAKNDEDVAKALELQSGRNVRVYTGVTVQRRRGNQVMKSSTRICVTSLKFKRLSAVEKQEYLASKQGVGKGGALAIEGIAAKYIKHISGSYHNVMGLPVYDVHQMLTGIGN